MTADPDRRPRDSQRARLYRAEDEVDPGRRLPTVDKLQAYVDSVAGSDWFRSRWGDRAFEVRPGHGHRRATADANGVLQLPRWARTEVVVLHEVAHCLTPVAFAAHGPEYAGVLLALVRRAVGPGTAQKLEDAFARQRVRWTLAAVPVAAARGHRQHRVAGRHGAGAVVPSPPALTAAGGPCGGGYRD